MIRQTAKGRPLAPGQVYESFKLTLARSVSAIAVVSTLRPIRIRVMPWPGEAAA